MNDNETDFESFRQCAARSFARTMIVVDDEADYARSPEIPGTLKKPDRGLQKFAEGRQSDSAENKPQESIEHALNAKKIIDRAMELGLICSVMRPAENEIDFKERVVEASKFSDIVCLDWEIYTDKGDAASEMIRRILENDDKMNGRVRCIAIYTGDTTNNKILQEVMDRIPEEIREKQGMTITDLAITGKYGIRIICLFKSHGIQLPDSRKDNQIDESGLPERLQDEFAKLSEGVLSNVALVTIASIRDMTHQILARFSGDLDGPWFHHRATIANPEDAEEYAVNVVLSEIKGAIDIRKVGELHAGQNAIKARIREISMEPNSGTLPDKLRCNHGNAEKHHDLGLEDVIKFVVSGLPEKGIEEVIESNRQFLTEKAIRNDIKPYFSSLFYENWDMAREKMDRFASLTGVQAYPGSYPGCHHSPPRWVPMLGLGTIIKQLGPNNAKYLLCLQASCDAVRIEQDGGRFIFVPLESASEACPNNSDHVVPIPNGSGGRYSYIGLKVPKISYRAMLTITFCPSEKKVVEAERNGDSGEFVFSCSENKKYMWIADIKRRRALRTAQDLGGKLGRLGFDEFEPYRKSRS